MDKFSPPRARRNSSPSAIRQWCSAADMCRTGSLNRPFGRRSPLPR